MSSKYEKICDVCEQVTKGYSEDEDVKNASWQLNIYNHWYHDTDEGIKKLMVDREVDKDLCSGCALHMKQHIDNAIKQMRSNYGLK